MASWTYAPSISRERAEFLLAPRSFEQIVKRIAFEMQHLCCHSQTCDENNAFVRIVYCLRISVDTFDLFYNSPNGYRGAYFRSPFEGLIANANLLRGLFPRIAALSERRASADDQAFVCESLSSTTAKVWLAEHGMGICEACEGEWGNPSDDAAEILNGRWDVEDSAFARRGRKAPRLTKVRVFGAFLDSRHNELVPNRKRYRANQIHQWGWS
jgi:hypothetical protein